MEKTGDVSSAVESSLYQCVHAMLRELETHSQAGLACNKGMLRWTLHKKVENNPSSSISLLRFLLKELEKAEKTDGKIRIIPLLHSLAYAIIQTAYIPEDLCARVYACLKRMATLPEPYCTIGLHYAKHIKTEHNMPGIIFQRRVIAEHSLKNEHYPHHERVFVFVDPAVFPQTLLNAVKADVEFGALDWDTISLQRRVLLHTLQAGLGKQCHGQQLKQALEDLDEDVEKYFQDVTAYMEERMADGASHTDQYSAKLKQIYWAILSSAGKEQVGAAGLTGAQLPSPEISFHVWTKEDEIWNEMINFILMVSSAEDKKTSKHTSVISTMSRDSGIEGDLPLNELSYLMLELPSGPEVQEQQSNTQFFRRPCLRWPKAGNRATLLLEAIKESEGGAGGGSLPKEEKNFTARVVVMGDDRTLGKLGRAYYYIRKKDTRHFFLTKRVNLEMYYIPVTNPAHLTSPDQANEPATVDMLTLAASLGSVDPWYNSNINALGTMILKLAEMHSIVGGSSEPNSFLLDIISYYTRTAQQPIHIPIYSVKICFSELKSNPVEELFVCQLDLVFPKLRPLKLTIRDTIKGSVRYKRSVQEHVGVVVSVNYKKASISNREIDRGMCVTTTGVSMRSDPLFGCKNLDSLVVNLHDSNLSGFSVSNLRVTCVCIRTLEKNDFTVCLDKDSYRTFKNVQSVEVSPCTDPGYCFQKSKSRNNLEEDDSGLSKYLSKTFSLPINMFSGAVQ